MEERITEHELMQKTVGKHTLRFLQTQGLFTKDIDGLYDPLWVDVYVESRAYMRAGFDELSAYAEACKDTFGYYPEWY